MNRFKIDSADIFLENYALGQGKIIISDPYNGDFSYYWGSMGEITIEEFLSDAYNDAGYFAGKLSKQRDVFDSKGTASHIRRVIRESTELPFYKYMEGQKVLRRLIKELEDIEDERDAHHFIYAIPDNYELYLDLDSQEKQEFNKVLEQLFCHDTYEFLQYKPPQEYYYLHKLFKKISEVLKNQEVVK